MRKDKIAQSITNNLNQSADHFFLPKFSEKRIIAGTFLLANMFAVMMVIIPARNVFDILPNTWLRTAFFVNWVVFIFALGMHWVRPWLLERPRRQAMVFSILFFILLVTVFTLISGLMDAYVYLNPWSTNSYFQQISKNVLLGGMAAWLILRYLYITEQSLQRQRSELMQRVNALQARIRPHFLFNSMNTLRSLIAFDRERAERVVDDLSDLFRASLRADGEVTLLEEVNLCKKYIALELLRFGDRLHIEWSIPSDDELYDYNIPLLTLQPILENSVYHGVESRADVTPINVFIEIVQKEVTIVVTNPFQTGKTKRKGNGIALDNIKERLTAYYGPSSRVTLSEDDGVYTTSVRYMDGSTYD